MKWHQTAMLIVAVILGFTIATLLPPYNLPSRNETEAWDDGFEAGHDDGYQDGYHDGWHSERGVISQICDPYSMGLVMCLTLGIAVPIVIGYMWGRVS